MLRSVKLALALTIVLMVIVLGGLAWLPAAVELRLIPTNGGKPIAVLPLRPGERFTLHYYHSVENAPIWEEHSLDETGRIFIEEERYLKFGAGMGRMPGVGRMIRKGPFEAIVNMHMPVGDFILRVGSPGVDHTILWRDHQVNLTERLPHQAVQFKGRPVSRLYTLWRRRFAHPATPR